MTTFMPPDITETEWDGMLFRRRDALAKTLGWRTYHTLRSKGSAAGFPDRVLWRDRVIYAELKSKTGKASDFQMEVLDGLAAAGGEVYLWRPSDLDDIARILSKPWWLVEETDGFRALRNRDDHNSWTPGSLWVPERGRSDGCS